MLELYSKHRREHTEKKRIRNFGIKEIFFHKKGGEHTQSYACVTQLHLYLLFPSQETIV